MNNFITALQSISPNQGLSLITGVVDSVVKLLDIIVGVLVIVEYKEHKKEKATKQHTPNKR